MAVDTIRGPSAKFVWPPFKHPFYVLKITCGNGKRTTDGSPKDLNKFRDLLAVEIFPFLEKSGDL